MSARAVLLSSADWWNDVGELFHALGPLGNATTNALLWAAGRFDFKLNTQLFQGMLLTAPGVGLDTGVICNIYNIFKSKRIIGGVTVQVSPRNSCLRAAPSGRATPYLA